MCLRILPGQEERAYAVGLLDRIGVKMGLAKTVADEFKISARGSYGESQEVRVKQADMNIEASIANSHL